MRCPSSLHRHVHLFEKLWRSSGRVPQRLAVPAALAPRATSTATPASTAPVRAVEVSDLSCGDGPTAPRSTHDQSSPKLTDSNAGRDARAASRRAG